MSFVMIAAGPTSSARVRTVTLRSLCIGAVAVASILLAAGTALGYWASQARAAAANPDGPESASAPFAVEQLGALSGRLFRLESQARQLIERIGAKQTGAPQPTPRAAKTDSGGPMLPPQLELDTAVADPVAALAARLTELEQDIELAAGAAMEENLAAMRLPTRKPVGDAELVSAFGNRNDPLTGGRAFHAGLDFAAERGTPINAAGGGTVTFAGFKPDFGWMIEIAHGNGLSTRYAHASRLLAKLGQLVAPGDPIAEVGSSGRSTGPHLHFEVLRQGHATDPRRYLSGG